MFIFINVILIHDLFLIVFECFGFRSIRGENCGGYQTGMGKRDR